MSKHSVTVVRKKSLFKQDKTSSRTQGGAATYHDPVVRKGRKTNVKHSVEESQRLLMTNKYKVVYIRTESRGVWKKHSVHHMKRGVFLLQSSFIKGKNKNNKTLHLY